MTEIAALSTPHTLPLGSRGRHHSLYAWLLLLPLDTKPMIRSTSSGVLLYLTFAPELTAVLIHPLPVVLYFASPLSLWNFEQSSAFHSWEGRLSTIYHRTRIVQDGLTREHPLEDCTLAKASAVQSVYVLAFKPRIFPGYIAQG